MYLGINIKLLLELWKRFTNICDLIKWDSSRLTTALWFSRLNSSFQGRHIGSRIFVLVRFWQQRAHTPQSVPILHQYIIWRTIFFKKRSIRCKEKSTVERVLGCFYCDMGTTQTEGALSSISTDFRFCFGWMKKQQRERHWCCRCFGSDGRSFVPRCTYTKSTALRWDDDDTQVGHVVSLAHRNRSNKKIGGGSMLSCVDATESDELPTWCPWVRTSTRTPTASSDEPAPSQHKLKFLR